MDWGCKTHRAFGSDSYFADQKKKKTHRACPVSIPTFNLSCKEKILLFCCSVLSYTCPLSQVLELQPPNYSLTYHLLSI